MRSEKKDFLSEGALNEGALQAVEARLGDAQRIVLERWAIYEPALVIAVAQLIAMERHAIITGGKSQEGQ